MKRESTEKKTKKRWIIAIIAVVVVFAAMGCGGNTDETADQDATPATADEQAASSSEATAPELEFGDLLDLNENEIDGKSVVVVKAKISPQSDNKKTIDQNYYTVVDLIQKQGFDKYDELQYWAVADMTDGSEQKVIAFTLDKDLINTVAAGSFPANTLGDYVADLWILPSLEQ